MANIPPGIVYLAHWLPTLAGPPAATYLLAWLASSHTAADNIPLWALHSAAALTLPLLLAIKVQWGLFKDRREAARLGANLPPANPDSLPGGLSFILGSSEEFESGYPGERLGDLVKKLGNTFAARIFFETRVVTVEPDHIKALLTTQFDKFEKGPEQCDRLAPLLGTGVFAADGDLWKFHRAMTRPFFTRDRISHFDIFDRHAEEAIEKMKARLNEGLPIDFQDVVARFTMDSATEFLFGHCVRSLSEGLPYPFDYAKKTLDASDENETITTQFIRSFSEAQALTAFRMRFGVHWPLVAFWKDDMKHHMKVVHSLIDPIVAAVIKKKEESTVISEKDEETLLENLVNSTKDPVILRDETMNLLVAGRDTTASLLTFTVYMLAEHPHVLFRLRNEIIARVGLDRMPTFDDFREMKYLRAVLNETLRLYPPVPFNLRVSKEPVLLPSLSPGDKPIYIPPNVRVPYSVMIMHRREDLWGPDALEFDPDRFLDQRLHKYLTPNPFIFLPFNAGPRICLGQQFAYHEASFFLVRLLQNFSSVSLAPEAQPPASRPPAQWDLSHCSRVRREKIKPRSHLTMYSQGGLWVRFGQGEAKQRALIRNESRILLDYLLPSPKFAGPSLKLR